MSSRSDRQSLIAALLASYLMLNQADEDASAISCESRTR